MEYPKLYSNYDMNGQQLKNRFLMAPMTRSRATEPNNTPNPLMATYYGQRVSAGIIITEATQVSLQGQGYALSLIHISKNAEQIFALHALLNPEVKLVSLYGVAGTGKTLLALAGALQQRKLYKQIYLARPIVPLSNKDLGYLPGDIKSKIDPYMQPLWDNLYFIQHKHKETGKLFKQIDQMVHNEELLISPLAYIRGRSLSNIIFIVDEAQNLTPHEVKTIITRAGENTKFVFTGDIHQIDTPYLDELSNGLSYLVDRLNRQNLFAHIKLEKGERSELANLANELL